MAVSAVDRSNIRSPDWIPLSVSHSLNHGHITEALSLSPDNGETLVFSKLDLTDIGVDALEELATEFGGDGVGVVKRIALGNNRLTTLPTELALLTRLRYLNLRHNSFSSFPRVLTLIQSLDTLDISHNKIRRLPNEPGSLVNLRVFCLSRNKISRLPTYLPQFHKLEVLRVDRNPLEWPPTAIVESPSSDDLTPMKEWIQAVQRWIEMDYQRQSEDSIHHDEPAPDKNVSESWRLATRRQEDSDEAGYHRRSYSVDSNTSLSSISESLHEISSPEAPSPNKPPPLHLGILQGTSPDPSPTRSPGGESPPSSDYDVEIPDTFEQMQKFELPPPHTRTVSYAEGTRSPIATTIPGKKSLPNLRGGQVPFIDVIPTPPLSRRGFGLPSPLGQEESLLHSSSSFTTRPGLSVPIISPIGSNENPDASSRDRIPSIAIERNSYFRRLPTLPPSNTLPQHLTHVVESSRTFLFAMCQIYQSLEQYSALVTDDRFSMVLRKVLEPAHSDIMQFIQALEIFDSTSQMSLPAPAVCRSLLEKCRDCAAAFGKAVNVLILRLQVDPGEDPRFSRWVLLELHAATAEISGAWKSIQGHADNLKLYLRVRDNATTIQHPPANAALGVPSHITLRPGIPGQKRTTRRHAGSFSIKDVEIGKKLPSNDTLPALTGGVLSGPAPHIRTLRTPKRQATAPMLSPAPRISSPAPSLGQNTSEERSKYHFRQNSQRSNSRFSPSSSPSFAAKNLNLDLALNSKRKVDFEALNAIQHAVEAAPRVWNMAETFFASSTENKQGTHAIIEQAQSVTRKLSDIINKMNHGDSMPERKVLQDDAQLFVKVVVEISNLVKAHSVKHSVPSTLRSSIVKLTNLTEEFAMFLHVSSFTPSTPRSFSPMLTNSTNFSHDGRLASNLSRAKSTHSPTIKIPHPALHDGPRSALPTQSFKIHEVNPNHRLREPRDAQPDAPELG